MIKKIIKVCIFIIIVMSISLFALYYEQKIPVLGYHSFYKIKDEEKYKGLMTMNIKDFDKQMKYLYDHNYKTLSMDEFYCWKNSKCDFPRKSVVITLDDGFLSNYLYAFDILKKYDFKATVFIIGQVNQDSNGLGDSNSYMSYEQIKEIEKEYPNIAFESHTYNMHDFDLTYKTEEVLLDDINKFKEYYNTRYHAYPYGLSNKLMRDTYKNNGFNLAFGFGPNSKDFRKARKSDDNYNIPRLSMNGNMCFWKFKLRLLLPF